MSMLVLEEPRKGKEVHCTNKQNNENAVSSKQ